MKVFIRTGFVPLVLASGYDEKRDGPGPNSSARPFATLNLVLLPSGHPAISRLSFAQQNGPLFDTSEALTRSMFGLGRSRGEILSQAEIVALVAERLRKEARPLILPDPANQVA